MAKKVKTELGTQVEINYCELCQSCNQCMLDEPGEPGCEPILVSEEELKRQFVINNQVDDTGKVDQETHELLNDITEILDRAYRVDNYKLHDYMEHHIVCSECEGSGYLNNEDMTDMVPCEHCNGTGIIDRDPVAEGFVPIYFIHNIGKDNMTANDGIILDSPEGIQSHINKIAFQDPKKPSYEVGTLYISKDCVCDDYMQTTYALIDQRNNPVDVIGMSNYFGIHQLAGIPFFYDVETYTKGCYKLLPMAKFKQQYMIQPVNTMSKLYVNYLESAGCVYTNEGCSYPEGLSMFNAYFKKYPTLEAVHQNLLPYLETEENYTILDDQMEVLDKVIEDFSLVGCFIHKINAAKIIKDLMGVLGENTLSCITEFNAAAVYIIEYICISAEYDTISEFVETIEGGL